MRQTSQTAVPNATTSLAANTNAKPKTRRTLRYLHAMYATNGAPEIEGMLSGPGIFWHYQLVRISATQTQVLVLNHYSTARDARRLQRRFVKEVLKRVSFEQTGEKHFPKLTKGQFYLRRGPTGTLATHVNCIKAVATKELDQRFVDQLHVWNLRLIRP
jgi:hypothetical protein